MHTKLDIQVFINAYVTGLIRIQGDSESSQGKSEFEFVLGETRIPIYTGFNLV